jgi:NADPH-dependent 2,4-dienoyl-CoA reductase/sulfur reductase-like enzyme
MDKAHYVVIGNGPAGYQAALTLRKDSLDARVTIVSKERGPSYRSYLLPRYVAGTLQEKDLFRTSPDAYATAGITLRSCQQVVDVRLRKKEVLLDHKEVIPFTGLIIAVGGKPRIPEPLLAVKDLMMTLKTLGDARVWIERLSQTDSVLMAGGDLTSLALTKALLDLGKKVYFLLDRDAFWPLRCDDALLHEVSERLIGRGVDVVPGGKISAVTSLSGGRISVRIHERELHVDIFGAFFGLVPDIGFLAGSGLSIDRGILVSETLNAGFKGVFATGDCAQIYHPGIRDYWVSIGNRNAHELGRIAALNLLGADLQPGISGESIFDIQGIKANTSWWLEF